MGHSRKHPHHPHGGNRKLTPLPSSDVLIHLLLSETIFSPLPLRTAEISSVGGGGVWIFSGTTQFHHKAMTNPIIINSLSFLVDKQKAKKRRVSKLSAIELLSKKYDKKIQLKEKELEIRKMELELNANQQEMEITERRQRLELEKEERWAMIKLLQKKI
jgi:hypothetical protein